MALHGLRPCEIVSYCFQIDLNSPHRCPVIKYRLSGFDSIQIDLRMVSLRLDSIDWSAKTLKVEQCKTRSTLVWPLIDRTILILHRYLRRGRSCSSHPQLFLPVVRLGELTRHAVADIFEKRSAQSGLPIHGYSAYSLRHAFAMRLLKRGVGLKAIGDLLRHRNLASTCYYLRLDIDMLREVALPVPTRVQLDRTPIPHRCRTCRYSRSSAQAEDDSGTQRDLWNFDSRIRSTPA
jgi:hypothetical protein